MGRGRERGLRSKDRIFNGKLIKHLDKDVKHVHDHVEQIKARSESEGSEVREHLEEVDEHLHDLMEHGKDLKEAMPLTFLSEGDEGEIVGIRGGRGIIQRLSDMGFTPSTKVKVMKSNPPGPMLINVRDARIALGRGIAMKIIVNVNVVMKRW